MFDLIVLLASTLAGAVAGISGFGIGSILTPLLALQTGTKIAVALVSIPHVIATAVRFWGLRHALDRRVFIHFGILSAMGGLLGALLNGRVNSPALAIVFGCLLMFAGVSGLAGWTQRMRFGDKTAWVAGALSGFFGGLVGNQGGIRSAALLGFGIPKESLVATATAIGLVVDAARMPVYVFNYPHEIAGHTVLIVVAVVGVMVGTLWGVRLLRRIPELLFRRMLSSLILILGAVMFLTAVVRH